MAGIESIISGIFIGLIVVAGAGIVIFSQAKTSIDRIGQEQLFFSHETYRNNADTFLMLTDDISEKSLGTLISYSIYRRTEDLTIIEDDPLTPADETLEVNVPERLEMALDRMFGPGNYYLNVTPRLYDVSLSFIIDGSSSLKKEREELGEKMLDIIAAAETGERDVIVYVYVLSEGGGCNTFDSIPGWGSTLNAECIELHAEMSSLDDRNIYITANTPVLSYKREHDIRHPYRVPQWNQPGREWTARPAQDYYEADWGAGTAFASDRAMRLGSSKISILFPMAGELSTGSIADFCYTEGYGRRFGWDQWDEHFCNYCMSSCDEDPGTLTDTEARSFYMVERAVEVAIENNHIINPILAYRCNFYSPSEASDPAERADLITTWEAWNFWYYFRKDGSDSPGGAHTFCSDPDCQACTADHPDYSTTGDYNSVCFHHDCVYELRRQMDYMASETGGIRGDLNDVAALLSIIEDAIEDNLDPFRITIGTKDDTKQQFVYHRKIPLPVGTDFVDVYLHIYLE